MVHLAASARRYIWIVPVLLGLVFIGAGAYMVSEGMQAKDQVHDALVAEQITTSDDATIPGVLVDSPATARAQEEVIKEHTLGTNGPYSGMARDDPNRDSYIKGVTLRTALNQAVIGFKVSDLVIGMGAVVIVLGATNVLLMAPVMYLVGQGAPDLARAGRQHTRAPVPATGG
jgi:hypothetical protein